ncbi:MAG: DEAD/DEAH box helicase [Rikenellaceae bacterium]
MSRVMFENMALDGRLVEVLKGDGIIEATQIQQQLIASAMEGGDQLAVAQTGSGKTYAFLLPTIHNIIHHGGGEALILAPTRELAQQIGVVCDKLCRAVGLKSVVIVGGVEYSVQLDELRDSPSIITATPGRLIDLHARGAVELSALKYFILDEVDQMLDLGFCDSILSLAQLRREGAQSIFLSATLPSRVESVVEELMRDYNRVAIEDQSVAVERIEQRGYYVEQQMMDPLLIYLLRTLSPRRSIIFTRSRRMADRLTELLSREGFTVEAMHSERSQAARQHIIERFRSGEQVLLVATDIVARGVDVEGVDYIFNYGLPQDVEHYVHRIGRTARAGASGVAITLSVPADSAIVAATCRYMKQNIAMSTTHPYATPAILKELGGVPSRKKGRRK